MIIYLDQNKWIDLARSINDPIRFPEYVDVSKKIQEKIENDEWIFPLSLMHMMETMARYDQESKIRLAKIMAKISKNHAMKSFVEIEKVEFLNLFASIHDKSKVAEVNVIDKNLLYAVDAEKVGISFNQNCQLSDEIKAELRDVLNQFTNHEEIFTHFMKSPFDKELVEETNKDDEESKKQWEKIQKRLKDIPKEHKYNICLVEGFTERLTCHLKWIMPLLNKNKEEIIPSDTYETPESTKRFSESIPTLDVQIKLMYEILKDSNRPIKNHDNRDVAFLATAIPYCDVVITEKTWKHAAKMQNLDEKYSTKIENDLNFLLNV